MTDVYNEMIEITLPDPDKFRLIRETLTRIGIANSRKKHLWPSCLILNKGGHYYVAHFKSLLALDGQSAELTEEDQERTQDIAHMLQSWGLCDIVNSGVPHPGKNLFRVLKSADKDNWEIIPKYTISG